jgi:hypothetical protein
MFDEQLADYNNQVSENWGTLEIKDQKEITRNSFSNKSSKFTREILGSFVDIDKVIESDSMLENSYISIKNSNFEKITLNKNVEIEIVDNYIEQD